MVDRAAWRQPKFYVEETTQHVDLKERKRTPVS